MAMGGRWEMEDDENRQKYDIFGLSSMVCQLDRKPFLAAATSPTHTFLVLVSFFNFLRMFFRMVYGLWFLDQEAWTSP